MGGDVSAQRHAIQRARAETGTGAMRHRPPRRGAAVRFLQPDRRARLMPSGLPKPEILLQAAIAYLREELLPTLTGYHAYQVRVTINVLSILQRGLEKGEALDEEE